MGNNPITVPSDVHKGILAVRESGKTNMLDYNMVAKLAAKMDYPAATIWIIDNHSDYGKGIFQGFKTEEGDNK